MISNRETEEFEDDRKKWKIYFDLPIESLREREDSNIFVKFVINRKQYPLTEEDIKNLKQDLKDSGKFRIIKEGKIFLEK